MSRLTRDGTAEPVSRDQILRHARGQGNIIFPVQLTTSRIGNLTRLIHTLLYVMTIHTYIHTYVGRRALEEGRSAIALHFEIQTCISKLFKCFCTVINLLPIPEFLNFEFRNIFFRL